MAKLKQLHLINFGGYEDVTFDFSSVGGQIFGPRHAIRPMALFFGPNGIGKSTILEAIRITSNPLVFTGRPTPPAMALRSLIRDDDYQPLSDAVLTKEKRDMLVEAVYTTPEGDKKVVLNNNGFVLNELSQIHRGHAYYLDADNPINWSKFQMIANHADQFIDLAETIYGFPCDLDGEVWDTIKEEDGSVSRHLYYQDLIINKGDTKVHFSRMSAGEKKIATMIRQLCDPDNLLNRDIVMIDNIEMHVYYKRHAKMLDKLIEFLGERQLIATTHSSVMINHAPMSCRYDLEEYKPEYAMLEDNTSPVEQPVFAPPKGYQRLKMSDGTVIYAPDNAVASIQNIYNDAVKMNLLSLEQLQEDRTEGQNYPIYPAPEPDNETSRYDIASIDDFATEANVPTVDDQISSAIAHHPEPPPPRTFGISPKAKKHSLFRRFLNLFKN